MAQALRLAVPIPSWAGLMDEIDGRMVELVKELKGGLDANAFWFKFDQILADGHTAAHLLGQDQAGVLHPSVAMARHAGRWMADSESYYLHGFVQDILSGKYIKDGEFELFRVLNRARMYEGKMRGTAGQGFTSGSLPQDEFVWTLGATEDHCTDCPELAAMSAATPFTKSTIFQHPGDGGTPCLGNCKCHLLRLRDGATSQKPG